MVARFGWYRSHVRGAAVLLVALACWPWAGSSVWAAEERPSFLVVVADDMRHDMFAAGGQPLAQTPQLDRLAHQGLHFRNAFCTTSICAISRVSLLTGQYARRHKIHDFDTALSPAAWADSLPGRLRGAGYCLGFVGKWGIGGRPPVEQFDRWQGYPGQGQYLRSPGAGHLTDTLTEQALAVLRDFPAEQPFYLQVSYKAPHAQDTAPRQYPPASRYESWYEQTQFPPPPGATPEAFASLPECLRQGEGRLRWQRRFATAEAYQANVRDVYRLVSQLDESLGRLRSALDESGRAHSTVIVFTADNGCLLGEHGLADKWNMFEQSIRIPLLLFDPRQAVSGGPPRDVQSLVLNIDLAPTLLDLAGLAPPAAMQGTSLAPWLDGSPAPQRQEFFYEHLFAHPRIPPCEGVRTVRFKYIRYLQQQPRLESLFDLARDPQELHDLVREPRAALLLLDMRTRWARLREQLQ